MAPSRISSSVSPLLMTSRRRWEPASGAKVRLLFLISCTLLMTSREKASMRREGREMLTSLPVEFVNQEIDQAPPDGCNRWNLRNSGKSPRDRYSSAYRRPSRFRYSRAVLLRMGRYTLSRLAETAATDTAPLDLQHHPVLGGFQIREPGACSGYRRIGPYP